MWSKFEGGRLPILRRWVRFLIRTAEYIGSCSWFCAGKLKTADETRSNLERELESHRETHSKQVGQLRDEISEKSHALDNLRHEHQSLQLAYQSASKELEQVKKEENEKSQKLQLLQYVHVTLT